MNTIQFKNNGIKEKRSGYLSANQKSINTQPSVKYTNTNNVKNVFDFNNELLKEYNKLFSQNYIAQIIGLEESDNQNIYNNNCINNNYMEQTEPIQIDNYNVENIIEESLCNNSEWDKTEDNKLYTLVNKYGDKNWDFISQFFEKTRSASQCLNRWNTLVKPRIVKGPWNVEEDKQLIDWIKNNGPNNWTSCAELIPGRTGKQCRERWANALNPLLKKGLWEAEEDYIIFKLFKMIGSKWSAISNYLNGRTENSTKNRFYSTLRRYAGELHKNQKTKGKMNFDNLMNYFPIAYLEKTEEINAIIAKQGISENESLNLTVLKRIIRDNVGAIKKREIKIENKEPVEIEKPSYNNNNNKKYNLLAVNTTLLKNKRMNEGNINSNHNNNRIDNFNESNMNYNENSIDINNFPLLENSSYDFNLGFSSKFPGKEILEKHKIEALKKDLAPGLSSKNQDSCNKSNSSLSLSDTNEIKHRSIGNIADLCKINYLNSTIKAPNNSSNFTSIDDLTKKIENFCNMSTVGNKKSSHHTKSTNGIDIASNNTKDITVNSLLKFESKQDSSIKNNAFGFKENITANTLFKNIADTSTTMLGVNNVVDSSNTDNKEGLLENCNNTITFKSNNQSNATDKESEQKEIIKSATNSLSRNTSIISSDYNNDKMNSLINQLNDLEKLLKQTKTEIRKINI